jgi:ribose transport system ATP-binding protein
MFDTTRGIDVGTKYEIYQLMHEFVAQGGGILFYSTDITELVNVADRVMVIYRGRVVRELSGEAITEQAILEAELGHVDSTQVTDWVETDDASERSAHSPRYGEPV